jgi:hypothetical protein
MFTPVTQSLIERPRLLKETRFWMLQGGAGEPSLTIAILLAQRVQSLYTDGAPEMVAAAKRRRKDDKLKNVVV